VVCLFLKKSFITTTQYHFLQIVHIFFSTELLLKVILVRAKDKSEQDILFCFTDHPVKYTTIYLITRECQKKQMIWTLSLVLWYSKVHPCSKSFLFITYSVRYHQLIYVGQRIEANYLLSSWLYRLECQLNYESRIPRASLAT
jgi:hypothetical protein